MSKTKYFALKIVFTRNIIMASGKNKKIACFSCIGHNVILPLLALTYG
jgi:hypothetical protein